MPQFTYMTSDRSHTGNKLFFFFLSLHLKEYLKPQRKQNQVAEDSWYHEESRPTLLKICMTYGPDSNLNWSQLTAVFICHFTSEKPKMFRELQMGKIDGRNPRNGELCTSNTVPDFSKEQRLIGIRKTTIS